MPTDSLDASRAPESMPAVFAEGLVKRFGATEALRGVDLTVERATVLGVLGPNGAGKTTAVRILTTLLRPDAGRAFIDGIDVVADPRRARARIGLTGQYAAVDERLTGFENLEHVGRLFHQQRARGAASAPANCSSASTSPMPPTVPSAPTRAACGVASTSP